MTGLEKKSRVRECVAESPFCYRENCLLYIPENLKATLKGSREEVEQLAGQIRDLVCSTFGHTLVLFTSYTLMGNVQQLLRDQIPFPMVQVWRNSQEEIARFKKMEKCRSVCSRLLLGRCGFSGGYGIVPDHCKIAVCCTGPHP